MRAYAKESFSLSLTARLTYLITLLQMMCDAVDFSRISRCFAVFGYFFLLKKNVLNNFSTRYSIQFSDKKQKKIERKKNLQTFGIDEIERAPWMPYKKWHRRDIKICELCKQHSAAFRLFIGELKSEKERERKKKFIFISESRTKKNICAR